jgi:hypothetical protein
MNAWMRRHLPGRARAHLVGQAIVLIDGDFSEARDMQQALQHAGARVIRPLRADTSEMLSIANSNPGCAVVDPTCPDGIRSNAVKALLDRGVPCIFVINAERESIPPEFSQVPTLQKPVDLHALLKLAAELCGKQRP